MGYQQRVCIALLVTSALATGRLLAQMKPGVVVEEMTKHSEGERAGLQGGDVLLTWSRGDTKDEITSPFDLSLIEIEQAPRGNVTLEGFRGTEKRAWVIGPDDWGLRTRPQLPPSLLSTYLEGQSLAESGRVAEAANVWQIAAAQGLKISPLLAAWFFSHAGAEFADLQRWKESNAAYDRAIQQVRGIDPLITAQLFRTWAEACQQRDDLEHAKRYYRQAIAASEQSKAATLFTTTILDKLSFVLMQNEDLKKTDEDCRHALATILRFDP